MIDLKGAIRIAREEYHSKVCRLFENEKAYIVQFADDEGDVGVGICPLRVDKESGEVTLFSERNPEFFLPLKQLQFPKGMGNIFIRPKPHDE